MFHHQNSKQYMYTILYLEHAFYTQPKYHRAKNEFCILIILFPTENFSFCTCNEYSGDDKNKGRFSLLHVTVGVGRPEALQGISKRSPSFTRTSLGLGSITGWAKTRPI